jgi:hypothetical protein
MMAAMEQSFSLGNHKLEASFMLVMLMLYFHLVYVESILVSSFIL